MCSQFVFRLNLILVTPIIHYISTDYIFNKISILFSFKCISKVDFLGYYISFRHRDGIDYFRCGNQRLIIIIRV